MTDSYEESDTLRRGSFEDRFGESRYRPEESRESLIQPEKPLHHQERNTAKKEEPKKKGKSLVELLTNGQDAGTFARSMNLDPEMSEKILVPLLSLLDKYNIGESVTANPRVESATNAFEVIRDVAPVIRGAAEFISGRQQELKDDDMAYLDAIRQSQSVTDASLFSDDDDDDLFLMSDEEVEETPEPVINQPPPPAFNSFGANDWNAFFSAEAGGVANDPLDNQVTRELEATQNAVNAWASQQSSEIAANKKKSGVFTAPNQIGTTEDFDLTGGMPVDYVSMMDTQFAIVDVSDLAKEQGLSVNDVMKEDSQRKINGQTEDFEPEPFDLTDLAQEEESEVDYSQFEVPDNAMEYDPLTVEGFEIPQFTVEDLENDTED